MPDAPRNPTDAKHQLKLRGVDGEVVSTGTQRHRTRKLGNDDEDEISDLPQRADMERFSAVTRTCPECKKEVFDDVAACYHCGAYLDTSAQRKGPPAWVLITAGVIIVGLVLAVVARVF